MLSARDRQDREGEGEREIEKNETIKQKYEALKPTAQQM
jgi:hypothetical protein